MNRLIKCLLLCGGLALVPVRPVLAADPSFINFGTINYPGTTNSVPNIDATNFVNFGSFIIDFIRLPSDPSLYETHDTMNYTNTGTMTCDTGYLLDNAAASGNFRTISASINNSGTIACASTNDLYFALEFGGFSAWATNIVNSGTVDVGEGGSMIFNGQNIDLSSGTFIMEGGGANASGSGSAGTNFWDPGLLGTRSAESGFFPIPPFFLLLTNSTAYVQVDSSNGGSNNVIRGVFIQDNSSTNVSYSVSFNTANIGFGPGSVTIQWAGVYQDVATANFFTNYLYLNNDYVLGASTNVLFTINGYPDNLFFTSSSTPLPIGAPSPPGFPNGLNPFPPGEITNLYSFGNVSLLAGTEGTNQIINGNLTNFEGRIEFIASNELNMAGAQVFGPNYLSVQSPVQFDGSPGATIQAPYSDLNVGVTNGFLSISNLLEPQIPDWSGTIQAWDTRWVTSNNGITNDYRVLLVGSDVTPTTLAQVQNLFMHGTNTLLISDALNVMNVATGDAQNLALTTNGPGNGATSVDGELNIQNVNFTWPSAFPNLLNVTNYGGIRLQGLGQFIGTSNSYSVIPGTPVMSATGTLVEISGHANVAANDSVTVGFSTYTFVGKLTNSIANQVAISSTFNGSMNNLIAAMNKGAGSGSAYSSSTTANSLATAGSFMTNGFTVTARTSGPNGNTTPIATTSANVTWGGNTTLMGGANASPATTNTISSQVWYQNFLNYGLVSDQASSIWADNFVSSGAISNTFGSFTLQSLSATLTNGLISAVGDVSITADSLTTSNLLIQSGRSLTLQATNLLTDGVPIGPGIVTNGNLWVVGGASSVGLKLPVKPTVSGLLGTTITNNAPANKKVLNTWAGQDYGVSAAGFSNNAAIGRLILVGGANGRFTFTGTGISNALYVDDIEFVDQATNRDGHGNPIALTNTANMVIYYAQALFNGVSVAELLNHANNNHLRWVPQYVGHYSSEELFYNGTTNIVNAALANSPDIDSNGNGIPNASDPSPFFLSSQVDFTPTVINLPPWSLKLQWQTIPEATNLVQYTTNLLSPAWVNLTNFSAYYYGPGSAVPGVYPNGFISPQPYPSPATNVWVYDAITNSAQRYYRVLVNPNATLFYGP
ncbi:MAG TPA: hypothetical protein VNX46_01095 [Candidatus Acidoferrum sp.]|nr:hypothetical protein [Candidatus Acidoferrum sp.]